MTSTGWARGLAHAARSVSPAPSHVDWIVHHPLWTVRRTVPIEEPPERELKEARVFRVITAGRVRLRRVLGLRLRV